MVNYCFSDRFSQFLKSVNLKLDFAGNCIITEAIVLLYHICKEKKVNSSYSACHKKRKFPS